MNLNKIIKSKLVVMQCSIKYISIVILTNFLDFVGTKSALFNS